MNKKTDKSDNNILSHLWTAEKATLDSLCEKLEQAAAELRG